MTELCSKFYSKIAKSQIIISERNSLLPTQSFCWKQMIGNEKRTTLSSEVPPIPPTQQNSNRKGGSTQETLCVIS